MCLRTYVASDCRLPDIAPTGGFAVCELGRFDEATNPWVKNLRLALKKPFIYYVECIYCGCELGAPLDPIWEEDLDIWLQREAQETLDVLNQAAEYNGTDPPNSKEIEASVLEEEWSKRSSRRLFWKYLVAALETCKDIDVFGGWAVGPVVIQNRRVMSLDDFGVEGVQDGVLVTVVPNPKTASRHA